MKKVLKGLLATSILSLSLLSITSCNQIVDKESDKIEEKSDEKDYRYTIYQSALESGYTGTYEEWLNSIKGAYILLQINDGYIQMKYSTDTNWTNLLSLESLKGKDGTNGSNGKTSEMRVYDGFIQWKYQDESDTNWRNLISISALTGADGKDGTNGTNGKEIELSTNAEYVIWRYEGENTWKNLISLETIKGTNGINGKSAYEIAVELGYKGTAEEWLESLKGQNGNNGTNGKSAYEIYCEKYPNYNKTEEEWLDDLVNGRLADKEVLTVSFVVDDETIDTKECYYGTPIEKPTNPTKEGYTFDGWYVDDEKWLFSVYPVYSNLELKAKFTENIYTVSINGASKEYKYNEEITLEKVDNTESIVYEGYVDTKGKLYEFNSKYIVKSDEELTLKSHHKQIIFNAGDGQCNISSMEVTTGETTDALPIATKENYVFRGWLYNYKLYTDAFLYEFNDDIELVASFRSKDELFDYDTTANGIIINKYLGTDNSIVIPEKINGLNVIEIKNTLIDGNNKNIVSLTIPETVNTIGDGILEGQSKFETLICTDSIPSTINKMFNVITSSDLPTTFDTIKFSKIASFPNSLFTGNTNKYNVVLPDDIKQIPSFTNATMIKSIIIPEGVTSIGYHAFEGCSSLTSITIPESVTRIKDNAFYGCSSLPSIVIPESVTSIGYYAFEGCSSLTSITIPAGVTSIETSTFCGCSSLESIIIPAGVTSIGYYAFLGCSSLTSITIPAGVTSIENYVFQNCSSLTSITIPVGVTSIGYQAFSGCSSLTSITLPESVTSIGEEAFYKCSSLTKVYYKGTSPYTDTITSIAGYNEKLTSATWYYFTSNGANETASGNWWYYDTDGVTIIEKVIE